VIVLGIDPGSRTTGFGVIRRDGSRLIALGEGRIVVPPVDDPPTRLFALTAEVERLVERFRPDAVVLESLFHGVNSRSLIVLAQARGAILAALGRTRMMTAEYSPAEVKRALTGNGRADKVQVAKMVRLLLGLEPAARSADATDALAVAICFAQRQRLDALNSVPARSATRSGGC